MPDCVDQTQEIRGDRSVLFPSSENSFMEGSPGKIKVIPDHFQVSTPDVDSTRTSVDSPQISVDSPQSSTSSASRPSTENTFKVA